MSKSIKSLLLASVFAALGISLSWAQSPSGTLTNFISADVAPVYDITGSYLLDQNIVGLGGTPVDLSFQVSLIQKAGGNLRNVDNVTLVSIGNNVVAGRYSASGRVLTVKGEPHARFNVNIHNRDVVAGVNSGFNIHIRYDLVISPGGSGFPGSMSGTAKGSGHFGGIGGGQVDPAQTINLGLPASPFPMDGSWTLSMNVLPLGHLNGTATITLSNGRALQTRLRGNFSESTGISKVNLTGIQGSQGNNLHVEFTVDTNNVPQIQTMHGHLLGQLVQE